MDKQSIGTMDILDEVNIEFDLVFNSIDKENRPWSSGGSSPMGSIIGIGNNGFERFPALFYSPYSNGYLHFSFSIVNDWNKYHNDKSFNITNNEKYHIQMHWNQTFIKIFVNNSTEMISWTEKVASHAIVFDKSIYLCQPFPLGKECVDASISNLKIMTQNTGFNYLCDAENRFSMISGNWTMDDSECVITQTDANKQGAIMWLGDLDISSLNWRNYIIEATLSKISGDLRAGIIFRAQSVSETNDAGDHYWVGLFTGSLQMGKMNPWVNLKNHNFPFENNKQYTVKIKCVGDSLRFFIDDEFQFAINDDKYLSGSIGLRTYGASARYSSLKIEILSDNELYTIEPSLSPTNNPTHYPSIEPSWSPTAPSRYPTSHTTSATDIPSKYPTNVPSSDLLAPATSSSGSNAPSSDFPNEGEIIDPTSAEKSDTDDNKATTATNTLKLPFVFIVIGIICVFIIICMVYACILLRKKSREKKYYENRTEMNIINTSENTGTMAKQQIETYSGTPNINHVNPEDIEGGVPMSTSGGISNDEFIVNGIESETKGAVLHQLSEEDEAILQGIQTVGSASNALKEDEFEVVDEHDTCK